MLITLKFRDTPWAAARHWELPTLVSHSPDICFSHTINKCQILFGQHNSLFGFLAKPRFSQTIT